MVRAWNPAQSNVDDPFDYEFFPDASGARSLSLLVSNSSRVGECGDGLFNGQKQALMGEFANLATTTWRGGNAYIVPMSADNFSITLFARSGASGSLPIFGQYTAFLNERLQMAIPVTPNARHELRWLQNWVSQNGSRFNATVSYGSLTATVDASALISGLNNNLNRF
ncbi:MAG: hypothetical protein U0V87_01615 [Acidobacteriota bacterium]